MLRCLCLVSSVLLAAAATDAQSVRVTLHEDNESRKAWPEEFHHPLLEYRTDAFLFTRIPQAYGRDGVRRDFSGPVILRAASWLDVDDQADSSLQFMLRAGGLTRLWINDRIVASTPPLPKNSDGHQPVNRYATDDPWLRRPHPGHHEKTFHYQPKRGRLAIVLETMIGDQGLRHEAGEITLAMRSSQEQPWRIVAPDAFINLTDASIEDFRRDEAERIRSINDRRRRASAKRENEYWEHRHRMAAKAIGRDRESTSARSIDEATVDLGSAESSRQHYLDDRAFARRLYLQTLGVIPTQTELAEFIAQPIAPEKRREWLVDRVLADPRWAGHWTAYWMDVLAENPNILKPTLNNTGPFRWFLYDAMRDNLAVDRWVTNLISMTGSPHGGGPAGFALAAQNDVPMAAKAYVLSSAFLAANMKCARCHDAPYHDWTQGDLFSLAAMLKREAIEVPDSSSVPAAFFEDEEHADEDLITLSVRPGDTIQPDWPLGNEYGERINEDWLRRNDARERLALRVTGPQNPVFPKVIVNRVWKRMIGEGIIEPVDDWDSARASHPELLQQLADDFVRSGYDLKAIVRQIATSDLYRRVARDRPIRYDVSKRTLDAPRKQSMSGEQVVDSLHTAIGRDMDVDRLTFDATNTRKSKDFGNLGIPDRAWQLTSLSNERDRPSLTFPRAAAVCECLEAFGWTGSRQEPINQREREANVSQPGILANGTLSVQLTRLTDNDAVTQLCLTAESSEQLTETIFLRFLNRLPTEREARVFGGLLDVGFADRVIDDHGFAETPIREPYVNWSNHLSIEANEIRLRETARLRQGPKPTRRLEPAWREKAEDVVWALINTPEFQFIP